MPTPEDEVHWVLLARCNDRNALERLLRNVSPSLTRYLRHLVGDEHADDIAQEVFMIVCKKIVWLRRAELFRPWLFRVASRAAFRFLKKEKRWSDQIRNPDVLDQIPGPPTISRALVRELLSQEHVTPASRAVLLLHFEEGMTLPEIAAVLEVPLGTVKSRLAYGLATLRKRTHDQEQRHDRQTEIILRRSLDNVDRLRRRWLVTMGVTAALSQIAWLAFVLKAEQVTKKLF